MRQEEGGNIWVEASQDGWRDTLGVIHRRRLWLSAAGDDFRGADTLTGGTGQPFTVRFHLHPKVTASPIQDGAAVMRSEEHTSELQSLMRNSYAVLCLKKK